MNQRTCRITLLLLCLGAASGCRMPIDSAVQPLGTAPPPDRYRLGWGAGRTWSVPLAHTVSEVHIAVVAGLANLGITGYSDQGDPTGRTLEGFYQNKRFRISFDPASPGITELRLFCGWFGSERVRDLFEATALHLQRRDHRR